MILSAGAKAVVAIAVVFKPSWLDFKGAEVITEKFCVHWRGEIYETTPEPEREPTSRSMSASVDKSKNVLRFDGNHYRKTWMWALVWPKPWIVDRQYQGANQSDNFLLTNKSLPHGR
jgi:hypothetical protein